MPWAEPRSAAEYRTTDHMTTDRQSHSKTNDTATGGFGSQLSVVRRRLVLILATSPYRQPQSRLHGRARYGAGPAPVVMRMDFTNPARA